MNISLNLDIFAVISEVLDKEGVQGFVIGGYVRDRIMERDNRKYDIDITVVGNGISIAHKVARRIGQGGKVSVFKTFGTAMVRHGETEIEFVGARKESYSPDSRKPSVTTGTLEDDQNRRDFTINALAISLNSASFGELIDPFDGEGDIERKVIRTPLDPDRTFSDDPLRMMRAVRFATQLGFTIEEKTEESILRNRERITIVSAERITTELNKIIMAPTPSVGFILLERVGLLEIFFPELTLLRGAEMVEGKGHKDNFMHTLKVLDNLALKSDNLWLRWATLLHDIGKPKTKRFLAGTGWTFHGHDHVGMKMVPSVFRRLKLPLNEKMKYVQKLVQLHLRPIVLSQDEVTDSAVRRLLFDAGDDIDDLMMLCEADITSKNEKKVKRYLDNFALVREKLKEIEEKDAIRKFQPPVDGEEIMEILGIGPGKEIGIIKNAIKEAILEGTIPNEHKEAREYMLTIAASMDLNPVHGENGRRD